MLADPKAQPAVAAEKRTFRDRARQSLVLAALMFSSLGCYLIVLKWRGHDVVFVTHTPWDDLLPFRPEWVWAYLLPYLIGPVVIGMLTRDTFRWFVPRALTAVGVTLLIFIVCPTQTAKRPPTPELGSGPLAVVTEKMYRDMAEIDEPPANAAPSLHVSLTTLLVLALLRDFPRWWLVSFLGVGLVWLSTLLTRQHHLIDVVTGVLLACLVVIVWPRKTPAVQGGTA